MPSSSSKKRSGLMLEAIGASADDPLARPMILDDSSLPEKHLSFSLYRHTLERKTRRLLLAGQTERLDLTAANHGEYSSATLPYNYVVGILDRNSSKVQLYDAELFHLSRQVKNLARLDKQLVSEMPAKELDYQTAQTMLGESFGTKRRKQAIYSSERNRINIKQLESSVGRFIEHSIDRTIDTLPKAEEPTTAGAFNNDDAGTSVSYRSIPPYNAATDKVEEIFCIKDRMLVIISADLIVYLVIPEDAYDAMPVAFFSDSSANFQELQASFMMTDYVLGLADQFRANEHLLRCALYLHFLIRFRTLKEAELNKEAARSRLMPHLDPGLHRLFLGQFAEEIVLFDGKLRYKFPQLQKDRLLAYIAVLSLCLSRFAVNVTRLSIALQLPVLRTAEHFKAVGCVIEKPAKGDPQNIMTKENRSLPVKIAVLKAPISFPKPRIKGKK